MKKLWAIFNNLTLETEIWSNSYYYSSINSYYFPPTAAENMLYSKLLQMFTLKRACMHEIKNVLRQQKLKIIKIRLKKKTSYILERTLIKIWNSACTQLIQNSCGLSLRAFKQDNITKFRARTALQVANINCKVQKLWDWLYCSNVIIKQKIYYTWNPASVSCDSPAHSRVCSWVHFEANEMRLWSVRWLQLDRQR